MVGIFKTSFFSKIKLPELQTKKLLIHFTFVAFLLITFVDPISSQSSLAFQADSLNYCGYYKQEVEVRKQILSSQSGDTIQNDINYVLFKIASYYAGDESITVKEWEAMYEDIIQTYLQCNQNAKGKVAVEVGFLMADKAIEEDRAEDALRLLRTLATCTQGKGLNTAGLNLRIAQILQRNLNLNFEAIPYYQKAIEGFEANGFQNHYIKALAYNDLAYTYGLCGIQKEVQPNYEKATEIWTKNYPNDFDMNITAYNNALEAAIDYGDKSKAAQYDSALRNYYSTNVQTTNEQKKQINSDAAIFDAKALYYLSAIRYDAFNYNPTKIQASLEAQESLFGSASETLKKGSINKLLSSYDNACGAFYSNENFTQALFYNQKIEKLSSTGFYAMKSAANKALIYYYSNRNALSLDFTNQSLDKIQKNTKSISFLTLTTLKAENLALMGCYDEAMIILDTMFAGYFNHPISIDSIKTNDFGDSNNSGIINVLVHTGLIFKNKYLHDGRQTTDLHKVKHIYGLAVELFEAYYQKGIFNPSLDRLLTSIKDGLLFPYRYSGGSQNDLIATVNAIENISSQHLWKHFISKYSDNLTSNKKLLSHRNKIAIELSSFSSINEKDPAQTTKEDSLEVLLSKIDQQLARENPNYLAFQEREFQLVDLQKSLEAHQTLVRYYATDSSTYACKITKDHIQFYYLGESDSLNTWVKKYYKQITAIDFNYSASAHKLYQLLIQPLGIQQGQNVVFIPEKTLSQCPFESLLDQNEKPFGLSHIVSYAHSLKFVKPLNQNKSSKIRKNKFETFLSGFAPTYNTNKNFNRGQNGALLFNEEEVKNIANIYQQSQVFNAEKASKNNFLNSLGTSNIHHLAMHSVVDTLDYEQSSLVFDKGEKLYFYELYALNFPTELVVLSACNTGFGQYLDGEGMMSLSRALCYAGAKASIHSLWQVSDKETSKLMLYFYQYLKKGHPKDESLSLAKQQFLKENPMKTHPFYWSAFVVNGDISPISNGGNIFYLSAIAILTLLIYLIYQKISKSKLA